MAGQNMKVPPPGFVLRPRFYYQDRVLKPCMACGNKETSFQHFDGTTTRRLCRECWSQGKAA